MTYYYCDGEVKKATSIEMTESPSKFRFFNTNTGQITVEYKELTFTASVAPTTNIKIKYTFQFKTVYADGTINDWQSSFGYAFLPAGQTSTTVEVNVEWRECFDDGSYLQ